MAIKKHKFPSPKEVNSSPQPFDKKEIEKIKKLRDELNQIIYQLGQLFINKNKLKDLETQLTDDLKRLETEESNIAESLTKKYGKGSIDLETGTFTPST
jgi:small-conductance mechanosensitive channel